jgi:hypothetical protein
MPIATSISSASNPGVGTSVTANTAASYGLPGTSGGTTTFYPLTNDAPGIQAAINAAGAAGGGVVQLPGVTISLSTSLIPVSGVKLKGVPPQLTYASIPDAGNTTFAGVGTVLAPSGAFAAITWNTTVLGTPASQAAFSQSGLTNIAFEDLGFSGGTYGIFAGATNNASCWWSQFKNLYFIGQTVIGISLTNYQHCQFTGNYSYGCAWGQYHGIDVASSTLAPGNSTYYDLYCVNPTGSGTAATVSRNITFITTAALAAAADNNQFKMDRIQSNRFGGATITQAATMANGVANITITDGTKFAVGMPVSVDATQNGFTLKQIYFVASVAANVITLASTYGGAAQNATGAVAVNIVTTGFPCFEMIALSGSLMTNCVIDNLDVEGLATCAVLFQNCTGFEVHLSQVPSVAQATVSVCGRSYVNSSLYAPQSCNTDMDGNSNGRAYQFFGAKFGTTVGLPGAGMWYDSVSGNTVLSLGFQNDTVSAGALTFLPGTQNFLQGNNIGVKSTINGNLSPTLASIGGAISFTNAGAGNTVTLPTVTATNMGMIETFLNQTANDLTITAGGGQLFNNKAALTSITVKQNASVTIVLAQQASATFGPVIQGYGGTYAAGVITGL